MALAGLVLVLSGCSPAAPPPPTVAVSPLARPEPPDLATPESAVRSYLAWISYAYSVSDSEIASATMSPEEWVRVDAYVQYNLEQQRRVDQRLKSLRFLETSVETTHTLVPTAESWEYRYVSPDRSRALSPTLTAEYEVTYTLVPGPSGGWVVSSVEAEPMGQVK